MLVDSYTLATQYCIGPKWLLSTGHLTDKMEEIDTCINIHTWPGAIFAKHGVRRNELEDKLSDYYSVLFVKKKKKVTK